MKPRLYLSVGRAAHFSSWEMPYFERFFNVVDTPDPNTILFVFGPDVLASGAELPARKRIALLFPGFGYNPYHELVHRYGMRKFIDDHYDLVFANPGPIFEAFKDSPKIQMCPFSINVDMIKVKRYRKNLNSLLHASANYPQKDWLRSRDAMRLTGLRYEVFPPRERKLYQRISLRIRKYLKQKKLIRSAPLLDKGYESHKHVIAKYSEYDGFVHIAAETPPLVDGKYTATLFEAGLTGCILFWHDTLRLGNDFETIFDLSVDPSEAAKEILQIRTSIDVEAHSKRTVEEIYEHVNPGHVMKIRYEKIMELL